MKRFISSVFLAATIVVAPAASAGVLTFDDIGVDGAVPVNYGSLDWSGSGWSTFGQPQDPFSAHSGDFRAYSGFGDPDAATTIRSHGPIVFLGAWFAGLQGATVTFNLYLGDTLVATSATLDPTATPTYLASGYAGAIDRIVVASAGQGSYVMDDLAFIPEPPTTALALAGLALVGGFVRRRSSRAGVR